jgi:hypothetical protein
MTAEPVELASHIRDLVDPRFLEPLPENTALSAAGESDIEKAKKKRAIEQYRRGRSPYDKDNQPRDSRGRFRDILARLKVDLGESELNEVVSKIEDAQSAELRKDYGKSADAATDVVQMIDRLGADALNPTQLKNVRDASRALGKAIAYLPLPQGDQNAKLRYSDLPPTTQQLLQNMQQRIIDKLDADKAEEVLAVLRSFASGTVQLSSDDLQAELARLLAYLVH